MCGMAGWVSYDGNLEAKRDIIATMTQTMALRGPDAGGIWIDRHVGLGHRRLAIIDLAAGARPREAAAGGHTTCARICIGEVFSFAELRDQLKQLGPRFNTASDTEVV